MKPLTTFAAVFLPILAILASRSAAGTRTRGGAERFRRFQEPLVFCLLIILSALALRLVRVELGF